MKGKRLILVLAAALAALGLLAGGARSQQQRGRGDQTEEFHRTYPLAPGGLVSLENINGDVRVRGWDRNEVKVDAVKYAFTPERLREAEIVVDASAGSVRVETRYPHDSFNHGPGDRERDRRNQPAAVDYVLTVPRGARVKGVELINGALDVEGLTGEVEATSINGKVSARALTGPVKLSTINGPLEAVFPRVDDADAITLNTVNGPLTLTLPSDADAEVRASTVHGPIANDFQLPVRRGKYVGQSMAGRFGQGGARVRLETVNGPLMLRRAQDGRTPSPVVNLLSEAAGGEWDDVDREIVRGVKDAEREAQRAAQREIREAQREIQRQARERARETAEARRDREETRREAARARAEANIDAGELQREAERAARASAELSREISREVSREVGQAMAGGPGDGRRIERESQTLAAAGVTRVRVDNFDGPITVVAWDKPEVAYTAVKRAYDESEMRGIRVAAQARGGEVAVAATFDKSKAHSVDARGSNIVSFSSDASVELEVYVPRATALTLNSSGGRLRVEGVRGELDLRTGEGYIDVSGGEGRLRANTGEGRIRVVDFKGEAAAETGDGRITLDGDFTRLSARTGDGSISLGVPEGTGAVIETNAEAVVGDGVSEDASAGAPGGMRRWKVGAGGTRLYTLRTGSGQVILRRR